MLVIGRAPSTSYLYVSLRTFFGACAIVLCVSVDGSLGSALHARASSIRNVKLPLGRQNTAKRGPGHTPGSVGGSTAAGEEKEKEADFDGVSASTMASAEAGGPGKPKNVGWDEGGIEAAEKVEKVGVRILVARGAVYYGVGVVTNMFYCSDQYCTMNYSRITFMWAIF